jgi:hypothetical protein
VCLAARRAALVAIMVALGGWLGAWPGASTAAGSCASVPSIDDALLFGDIVFVGSVVGLENDDRWATVSVEERWRGADAVPDTVVVHGGPEAGTATSVDRVYQPTRYLFVVSQGAGFLVDDACSATRVWSADLASYRPAAVSAAPAVVAGSIVTVIDPAAIALVAALVLALLVAIVAYIVILRARGRPPGWMR